MNDDDRIIRHQHYLERAVERTGGAELDFALQLYQDPALLTGVLAEATLPSGDSRVALGLDPAGDGPWLVVTREGEFVTVLGKGMSPNPSQHRLAATQVASLVARVLRQRQMLTQADAVVPPNRRAAFLSRFFNHGSDVTREDFRLLVAWLPVMYDTYKAATPGWTDYVQRMLADPHGWLKAPLKRSQPHLKRMAEAHWALSAMLPLMAWEGRRHDWLEECGAKVARLFPNRKNFHGEVAAITLLPTLLSGDGHMGPALRAAWAVGRIGKPLLPAWKQFLRNAQSIADYQTPFMGLLVMAMRHSSLRAEILKLLMAKQPENRWIPGLDRYHAMVAANLEIWLANEQGLLDRHLFHCRQQGFRVAQAVGGDLAARYPTPESIPEDIARLHGLFIPDDIRDQDMLGMVVAGCCWVARVEADALFPPQEMMAIWRAKWEPEHSYMLLRRRLVDVPVHKTVRVEPKPGRNEPCSCGSGRKFKVCCGVAV